MRRYSLLIGKPSTIAPAVSRRLSASGNDKHKQKQAWQYTPCYAVEIIATDNQNPQQTADALALLCRILQVKQFVANTSDTHVQHHAQQSPSNTSFWVFPRVGIYPPWTSKALDILTNVGIECISHIVTGGYWSFPLGYAKSDLELCFDPMTQSCFHELPNLAAYFVRPSRLATRYIQPSIHKLQTSNIELGLGLSEHEISYLHAYYQSIQQTVSDAELMMFAQANSEHCRHKIFRAKWYQNGVQQPESLFDLIHITTNNAPKTNLIVSAYSDNAAVMRGVSTTRLIVESDGRYTPVTQVMHTCLKAETHNHPTAIAPYEGAATGVGGEIRDEVATGTGAGSKAGWCGYMVAHLHLANLKQRWEKYTPPPSFAKANTIMIEAPLGGSNFGNEFGRPNLMGFFRTLETQVANRFFSYHKPVMLAGGIGAVGYQHAIKRGFSAGTLLIVLGGPNMRIGIGGGSASSKAQGGNSQQHDFASVQRDNPEMQRRCQQVIDACTARGDANPILSIHDLGAGGMANAFPELVHDANLGASIDLDKAPIADSSLSGMEIWCNESQERYAIALDYLALNQFTDLCRHEKCPFAVIGEATAEPILLVRFAQEIIVNIPLDTLFGKLPQLELHGISSPTPTNTPDLSEALQKASIPNIPEALLHILACPSVASKEFLITIADRSITGLVAGESMVGPWQTPVADCAITLDNPLEPSGQAIALGERSPLAISNATAASRLAIAEALTNLASCGEVDTTNVIFSANWMAASANERSRGELRVAVEAASLLCQQLGIAIPVGKDSLAMQTSWQTTNKHYQSQAPVTLVISAITNIVDARNRLTPQVCERGDIWLIEPDFACNRMGNSAFAQVCDSFGGEVPDIDDHQAFVQLLHFVREIWHTLSAYHDRSDGGLWAALCEMAFSARVGIHIQQGETIATGGNNTLSLTTIHRQGNDLLTWLTNEEIGVLVQVQPQHQHEFIIKAQQQPRLRVSRVATIATQPVVRIDASDSDYHFELHDLLHQWQSVSDAISLLRDNPQTVYEAIQVNRDSAQHLMQKLPLTYTEASTLCNAPALRLTKPKVGIIREQGSNGHRDLAFAFHAAGFDVFDINMQSLREGRNLDDVQGIAACGGFSYGDVFGAGSGWAQGIRLNQKVFDTLQTFWNRPQTFTLGICNGCQMLSQLGDSMTNTQNFPQLHPNTSSRFEGRLVQLRIEKSASILLAGMQYMQLVVPVAHASGKFVITELSHTHICASYCNTQGKASTTYPITPNGSDKAIAGITNIDGRITLLMPHPERMFSSLQCPWRHPLDHKKQDQYTPWFRMFQNAYAFVD